MSPVGRDFPLAHPWHIDLTRPNHSTTQPKFASDNDLPQPDEITLFAKVQSFDAFDPDNDPYGEHDFVSVEHLNERYFAKIDYALDLQLGSDAPHDPTRTMRVLTIMRADEY